MPTPTVPAEVGRYLLHALTGESLDAGDAASAADLVRRSAALGWGAERLHAATTADPRTRAGSAWPPPAPAGWQAGAASWLAVVRGVEEAVRPTITRVGGGPLTADDRRLLADVPPHHGSV